MDDVKKPKKVVKAGDKAKPTIVKQNVNTHFLFMFLALMTGLYFPDKNIETTLHSLMQYIDSTLDFGDRDIDDCYIAYELVESSFKTNK